MSRHTLSTLRFRLILLVLMAIVPMFVLVVYNGSIERQRGNEEARRNALTLAQQAADQQTQLIENGRQLLLALSQLPEMRNYDDIACNILLADQIKQFGVYSALGATRTNGDVFCYTGAANDAPVLANEDYFQWATQTLNFALSPYHWRANKPTLLFVQPVVKDGVLQGALFAEMDLRWVSPLVAKSQLPLGTTVSIFDAQGKVLAHHPNDENRVGQPLPETPIAASVGVTLVNGTAELMSADRVTRLYGFLPMSREVNAYVSVGIPVSVAYAAANATLIRNLALLGLVSLLTFATALAGSNLFVLRQVNALVNATRRLSNGDWKTRSGLARYQGELGQLAQSFDKMASALENRETARKQAEESLRLARNQLNERIRERTETLLALDEQMKNLESQLQTQHALYQHLTTQTAAPIYRVDVQGCLEFYNAAFARLLNYEEAELQQKSFWALVPAESRERVKQFFAQQCAQKAKEFAHVWLLLTREGREVRLLQHVQLLMTDDKCTGWQAIVSREALYDEWMVGEPERMDGVRKRVNAHVAL